jgi:hypothetical protein
MKYTRVDLNLRRFLEGFMVSPMEYPINIYVIILHSEVKLFT